MPLTIRDHLKRGTATSKEIQAETGLSQTAVARQLRGMVRYRGLQKNQERLYLLSGFTNLIKMKGCLLA